MRDAVLVLALYALLSVLVAGVGRVYARRTYGRRGVRR